MSGGAAYVLDEDGKFETRCNKGMVGLETVSPDDVAVLRELIERHFSYTRSTVASQILSDWARHARRFVKVMPVEYRKVLAEQHLDSEAARLASV
jgi:glutamate synthase domain-containing protein 3